MTAHEVLLAPEDWSLDDNKLVFMEGHQAVVLYGLDLSGHADDPPVYMATNVAGHDLVWHAVCRSCSEFLQVIPHWEGASAGAMPHVGTARVDTRMKRRLDDGWQYVGEVNEMWAYRKRGRAVCYLKWDDGWRVMVGATSSTLYKAAAEDLGITFDG